MNRKTYLCILAVLLLSPHGLPAADEPWMSLAADQDPREPLGWFDRAAGRGLDRFEAFPEMDSFGGWDMGGGTIDLPNDLDSLWTSNNLSQPNRPGPPDVRPSSPTSGDHRDLSRLSAQQASHRMSGGRHAAERPVFALRFGWWGVDTDGDLNKVGEYQDLQSSPFFDVDTLHSDGIRTIDLSATGLDKESYQANMQYAGPWLRAGLDFQRYLRRLDHDPLTNMGGLLSGEEIIAEDLNVGEDYAIRVEDLKTSFKGKLTEHIKLRLNFRFLHKNGERQANSVKHCFGAVPQGGGAAPSACHVLSQRQRIDWQTVRFEPVIEGRFGPIRAEYSRPMRAFSQGDQVVTQLFGTHFPTQQPYALVPESTTQVDRLKLGVDLPGKTRFYGRLHSGDTRNKFRDTHRKFYGFDLRLTNTLWDRATLTGYATLNEQKNQDLPFFLPEEAAALDVLTAGIPPYGIRHPIDYFRRTVGFDASWRPFRGDMTLRGLSITAGAEQGLIDRSRADYVVQEPEMPPGPVVDQRRTAYTSMHVGSTLRWSPKLETYIRYKLRANRDPLFAVNRYYGYTNTMLPEEESLLEIGGTWVPWTNFLATATVGFENRHNRSEVAQFEEDNFPMTFTLWYAPTSRWSLSAGYGYYSNWIDQDITFPSDTPGVAIGDTRQWNYGGRGRVLSLGGTVVCSRRLTISAGLQFVRAQDAFEQLDPWPDLSGYSDVFVERTRFNTGFDWMLREHISAYFRYVYEDYEDKSETFNSGTAHMFLAGLSAIY